MTILQLRILSTIRHQFAYKDPWQKTLLEAIVGTSESWRKSLMKPHCPREGAVDFIYHMIQYTHTLILAITGKCDLHNKFANCLNFLPLIGI